MANLLPKEMLQAVKGDYRSRLILVGALMLIGLAFFTSLMLLPTYLVLEIEDRSLADQGVTGGIPAPTAAEVKSEQVELNRSHLLVGRIKPFTVAATSSVELIESVLSLRPKGVRVTAVGLSLINNKKGMTVAAEASTRDQVNQYREALSKDRRFQGVSIPVGALLDSEGGKFTITLTFAGT